MRIFLATHTKQEWWHTPPDPALGGLRQKNYYEFKTRLSYIVNSRLLELKKEDTRKVKSVAFEFKAAG